ncbi:MAG: hypothetical protein ACERKD_17830 [Prolixibacteraceae bacterium]
MEIKYQVFIDESLLVQRFIGEFSFDVYMQYIQYLKENYSDLQIRKVLIDFRGLTLLPLPVHFQQKLNQLIEMRQNITRMEVESTSVVRVFWVNEPLPTAIAHIFQKRFYNLNYTYCTSLAGVMNNLGLVKGQFDLERHIVLLDQTFVLR